MLVFALELIMLTVSILYTRDCVNGVECRLTVCYRFTLVFVMSISIVFIFVLLYHFFCVPCVRFILNK